MEEPKEISPWAAALMTAGGNILANNRPGVSYGNAIGSGVASFAPAYYATKGAQDRQKYIDTLQKYKQLEFNAEQSKAQQEAAQKQKFQSAIESGDAFQGMPQEQVSTINRAYQIGGADLARKVFEEYSTREPKTPTPFELYLKGDPRGAAWNQMSTPKTTVSVGGPNINMNGANEASKALGRSYGDFAESRYTAADTAQSSAETINKVNELLDGVESGPMTDSLNRFQAGANQLFPGFFDPEKIGDIGAAKAEAGKLVMEQLNAMKGPATENERAYLQTITIDTVMTPETRRRLGEIANAQAARTAKLADKVTELSNAVEVGEMTGSQARAEFRNYRMNIMSGDDSRKDDQPSGQAQPTQAKRYVFDPESGELVPK